MIGQSSLTLVNPQNGNLAFKIFHFEDGNHFDHVQRNNYFSLIWVKEGKGELKADFASYEVQNNTMYAFSPYQPFMFKAASLKGMVMHFHPDFFCIHKHQAEVACNGVLFNNIYDPPFTLIPTATGDSLMTLIGQMSAEMQNPALAQYELLVSLLKVFLITCSRLKAEQQPSSLKQVEGLREPFILQNLKDAIEQHYKTKHAPNDYAEILNITPKALAKVVKNYFNKTLTEIISERIIIEAKRELYLSSKSVKEIAFLLGFNDEHYFSRFFKNNAEVSPQMYRDTVGFARGNA